MTDLQTTGHLLLNGESVACSGCGQAGSLDLAERGPRETWPAWISCRECGHGEDHPAITNGLVAAAAAATTGRRTRHDADLFAAQWRHLTLAGECRPEFVLDDALALGEELAKIGQQEIRARKSEARQWWRGRKKAARSVAGQAAGRAKAAALTAAWDLQTGGAGPARTPRARCRTKDCKGGWVTITTRIHAPGEKAEKVQTPCGVCHRA
jgi:hypothetical protein